ncbi:MAG: polysaccharide pyruvyl transferase family protein [Actinomycetes bacterium]
MISKGGYVFVDRASLRSLLSFWQTAFPLIFAARTGATVVTGPTSIGPFAHPIARWVNGIILRSLDLVVARDALSFDEAVRLGVHSDRLALLPDIAFSLAPPTIRDTRLAQEKLKLPALARYACFVLRHDSGTSDPDGILKAQIHAARTLVHEDLVDYIVVARQVPNLISPPETTFLAGLPTAKVLDTGDSWSPHELAALYAGASIVVTSRLHAAIFALTSGTPAIAISIDGVKTEGVFTSFGAPSDWVVPGSGVRDQHLARIVARVTSQSQDFRPRLKRCAESARRKLDHYPGLVMGAISRGDPRA